MHRRVRHLNPAQCGAQIALDARFITGVADGAALSSWNARPNSSISATQANASGQPTYRASQINGRPSLEFDGSTDVLVLSAAAASLTNNVGSADSIAVLQKTGAGDSIQTVITLSGSTGHSRLNILSRNASSDVVAQLGRRLDADGSATSTGGSSTNPVIGEGRARWSSGFQNVATNGVASANSNYSSGSGNTSATNSAATLIGAFSLTAGVAGSIRHLGYISAVVVAVPAFSDPVRNRIRQSLGFSYRIATA